MAYGLIFPPAYQFLDPDGVPVAGGFLDVYTAGTSTRVDTYSDHLGAVPNTNPVELDASGRVSSGGLYFLTGARYKLVLADADLSVIWTQDNVPVSTPSS